MTGEDLGDLVASITDDAYCDPRLHGIGAHLGQSGRLGRDTVAVALGQHGIAMAVGAQQVFGPLATCYVIARSEHDGRPAGLDWITPRPPRKAPVAVFVADVDNGRAAANVLAVLNDLHRPGRVVVFVASAPGGAGTPG